MATKKLTKLLNLLILNPLFIYGSLINYYFYNFSLNFLTNFSLYIGVNGSNRVINIIFEPEKKGGSK